MRKVEVRRVNEWDGPAMLKIYAPYVGTPAAPEDRLPALADYIQRIDRYTYGLGWVLCEIDSIPAGFCYLTEDRAAPEDPFAVEVQLYARPDLRGQGVGKALWSLTRDILELGDRRRVTARTDARNGEALAFLAAMGFTPAGEEREAGRVIRLLRYPLSPRNPAAPKPTKPYLIENLDYERAREAAAGWVRQEGPA